MFEAIPEILTLKQGQEVLHIGKNYNLEYDKTERAKGF